MRSIRVNVSQAEAAKAEFAAKVLPLIEEIRSAGVQTLQGSKASLIA